MSICAGHGNTAKSVRSSRGKTGDKDISLGKVDSTMLNKVLNLLHYIIFFYSASYDLLVIYFLLLLIFFVIIPFWLVYMG
jgi:hypothetical protein